MCGVPVHALRNLEGVHALRNLDQEARDQKRVDFQRRILKENVEAARARRMAEQAALQERAQRQTAELHARQEEFDRAEQRAA